MVRRKKEVGAEAVEAEAKTEAEVPQDAPTEATQEATKHVLSTLIPGTMTEAGYVPRGNVQVVACDLYPGLDFKVHFRTAISYGILREDYTGPGDTPLEQECRKLSMIIADFEGWQFVDPLSGQPIPKPDPADWHTYMPIAGARGLLTDLYGWIHIIGIPKALNQSTGN